MNAPAPGSPSRTLALSRFAWPAAAVVVAAMVVAKVGAPASAPEPVVRAAPTVVTSLLGLARLEATSMHLEKVLEVKDHQQALRGLVAADDTLLFVASGEAVLGVDLGKLRPADVSYEEATKTAYVTLPAPEVFSTRFDEGHSFVHSRTTDWMARRNEGLEAEARRRALRAFEEAAHQPTAMDSARRSAEVQLRALATGWGARELVVRWRDADALVD